MTGKFINDLKEGRLAEYHVKKYLYNKFKDNVQEINQSSGKFSYYDLEFISVDGKKIYYEIKFDKIFQKSGNFAIEFECNKVPSGISKTKADWWCYIIPLANDDKVNFYFFEKKFLDEMIEKNRSTIKVVSGGDGFRAKMYLLNKRLIPDLENYLVFSCSTKEFKNG